MTEKYQGIQVLKMCLEHTDMNETSIRPFSYKATTKVHHAVNASVQLHRIPSLFPFPAPGTCISDLIQPKEKKG